MDTGLPSDVQWEALFNYIQNDQEMLTGVLVHPAAKANQVKKWSSLAYIVNDVDGATARKDGKQWRTAWNGMKSRARATFRKLVGPLVTAGHPIPDLNALPFKNVHHRRVIEMTGVESALAGLNRDEVALNNVPPVLPAPQGALPVVAAEIPDGVAEPVLGVPVKQEAAVGTDLVVMPANEAALGIPQIKKEPFVGYVLEQEAKVETIILDDTPIKQVRMPGPSCRRALGIDIKGVPVKQEAAVGTDLVVMPANEAALGIPQIKKEPFVGYVLEQEAKVETIILDDTPIKQVRMPGPSCRRALGIDIKDSDDPDLEELIEENKKLVRQVKELLHSMKF